MTAAQVHAWLFNGTSWREPEDWPVHSRCLAIALCALLGIAIGWVALANGTWNDWRESNAERAARAAEYARGQQRLAGLSSLQSEAQRLRPAIGDPLNAANLAGLLRNPHVAALESNGQVILTGNLTYRQLLGYLGQLGSGNAVPLALWQNVHADRTADGSLNFDATVVPVPTSGHRPLPALATNAAHAGRFGRDPFVIEAPNAGSVPELLTSLPDETHWPLPGVRDWPLSALRFLGTIGGVGKPDAIVAAGQQIYRVRIGDQLGKDGLSIRAIRAQGLSAGSFRLDRAPQHVESGK